MDKKDQIKNLSLDGHEIGLHSFSHNTNLANESYKNQMYEYKKNLKDLKKIINKKNIFCAYPSNSFDKKTIKVLKKLNIKFAFRSDHKFKVISNFEIKRIDHTLI